MRNLKLESGFGFAVVSEEDRPAYCVVIERDRAVPLANVLGQDRERPFDKVIEDWHEILPTVLDAYKSGFANIDPARWVNLAALDFHAPTSSCTNIYCSAANYRRQLVELIIARGGDPEIDRLPRSERRPTAERMVEKRSIQGEPYFFLRPTSGVAAPFAPLSLPECDHQMDWEVELGVVIGKRARNVSVQESSGCILGYTILNDITDRTLVYRKDFPGADWLRGKGMPESMPIGPLLIPSCFVEDVRKLRLRLWVNEDLMQDELVSDMIIDVPRQIAYLSSRVELLPGDIVATGTPAGTGSERGRFLRRGDVVKSQIDGLGMQVNRIV